MASLIGKALAVRNAAPPVPMGSAVPQRLPGWASGTNVELELALLRSYGSNGTVHSNVSLLASATAKPCWKLFRQQPADGRRRYSTSDQGSDQRTEVVQHAALSVLNDPASIRVNGVRWRAWTRFRLMEISGIWLELVGKSHWVVDHPEGSTLPLGLWPVRPDRMTPVPDKDRYLAGWVYTAPDGQERIPLLPTEVIYNCYPDPLDPYGGMGPVASVLVDVEAARSSAEWNRNFFVNSAEPGGVIQIDGSLADPEWNEFVDRWRETHRGVARAHRIAVLEHGATWVPNPHSLRDMEFTAGRAQSRDVIREALGMHKVMTGVTDDVNRANAQTGEEVFASWKIMPRLDRWRDVLNAQLLPLFGAAGEGVEYDYILPTPVNREQDNAELTAKAQAAQMLIDAGFDPDDVCETVGLPRMGVAERAVQAPALPPHWVPEAAPAGDGAAAPGPGTAAAAVVDEAFRALAGKAGWDSPARRKLAALNRAGVR